MSDFVEKTVGTLSNLFSNVGHSSSDDKPKSKTSLFWNFDEAIFIKRLKSATSKKEEEIVVQNFLISAEKVLSQPNVTEAEVEAYVKLAMICESLGFSASFIYVHAIKLAQKGNVQQKHTGYLAVASLLHPHHQLVILLTNTIQKDLESPNYAEVLLGLKAVCNLINEDTVHNVLFLVEEKLKHESPEVRKLAALTLDHCLQLANSESAYKMASPKLEKALTDNDLGVVSAVVSVFYNLIKKCPGDYGYLIDGLIQLQNQILQRQIPSFMEYQGIPAPWLQIKILKLLSLLCKTKEQSLKVFPILKSTLQMAEINHNISYAIIAELIETIVNIHFDEEMVQLAFSCAGKLLKSENTNLKYMGIQTSSSLIKKMKPCLLPSQQELIMECLNHSDEALKLKTLELLYHLANPSNAQVVCKKLIEHMVFQKEGNIKKELVLKVLDIANQQEDSMWYISTLNTLFLEAGNTIPPENISQIINIIHEDAGDLKKIAKNVYLDMCHKGCPPNSLVKVISLVLDEPKDFEDILQYLEKFDNVSNLAILISLRNAIFRTKKAQDNVRCLLQHQKFDSKNLKQVQSEILNVMDVLESIGNVQLKEEVDVTLSHLDNYVCQALENGLQCYKPQRWRAADISEKTDFEHLSLNTSEMSSISWDPEVEQKNPASSESHSYNSIGSSSFYLQSQFSASEMPCELPIVKNVWTNEGRLKDEEDREELNSPFEQVTGDNTETVEQLFAGVS